ncbi:asparaginase domain-containing protein, partial [Pseudomonas aeruginosa]
SAAALSFLLLDLPIPVLLTGSMLPAGAPGSDAWDNLVGALRVLQEGHARGVQVYFNDALLHGARVSKLRSDAFDAFAELPRPRHAEPAPVPAALGYRQPRREVNLAVLPLYPGLRAAHLRGLLDSGVEALLLECYGSGTGPSDDEELLATLREAHARGVLLAAVSQCAYGQVEFGVYAAGSRLRDAGLLSAGGMTREAALGKLFGLLGAGLGRDEAQRWFALDLCGENAD